MGRAEVWDAALGLLELPHLGQIVEAGRVALRWMPMCAVFPILDEEAAPDHPGLGGRGSRIELMLLLA
jgi:hypothetical protein